VNGSNLKGNWFRIGIQQNGAAEIIESEKVYGNQNKQPFYHMEERTGCLAIGLQPVF
jgi:hypothetical protein